MDVDINQVCQGVAPAVEQLSVLMLLSWSFHTVWWLAQPSGHATSCIVAFTAVASLQLLGTCTLMHTADRHPALHQASACAWTA